MKYSKQDAKAYARQNFRGVWAATLTPFADDLKMDEAAYRSNLRHWARTLKLGRRLYLCSTPPFLLQTAVDQRINDYTALAFAGNHAEAKIVRDSLNPAHEAFRQSRPQGKPQAHSKYWLEQLGQAGGPVRRPLLQMSDAEKALTRKALARSGLRLS